MTTPKVEQSGGKLIQSSVFVLVDMAGYDIIFDKRRGRRSLVGLLADWLVGFLASWLRR